MKTILSPRYLSSSTLPEKINKARPKNKNKSCFFQNLRFDNLVSSGPGAHPFVQFYEQTLPFQLIILSSSKRESIVFLAFSSSDRRGERQGPP